MSRLLRPTSTGAAMRAPCSNDVRDSGCIRPLPPRLPLQGAGLDMRIQLRRSAPRLLPVVRAATTIGAIKPLLSPAAAVLPIDVTAGVARA